jgi:hypothetical protein
LTFCEKCKIILAYSKGYGYAVMAYLLKATTVELKKQTLLDISCLSHISGVTVGSGVYVGQCLGSITWTRR